MRVALFVTCLNDTMFPQSGRATVSVLERVGASVAFPMAQTCCGQMHVNTGYRRQATDMVRAFLDAFESHETIVAPSSSCTATIRHHYSAVAAESGDPLLVQRVEQIVPRVFDLSEFLIDVVQTADVGAYFPHTVTYHATCHSQRAVHLGDRPYQLLRAVRGLRLLELANSEECCGFGGTFSVKNPDVSVAMGSDKARHVRETGAEVLVAADRSCLMHIGGLLSRQRSGIRVMHLAEVLASTDQPSSGTAVTA
ncbi:MAG: (Fe-S)-binding protein [Kineosporiaceae bacterium]|nr:(Fe-S)-binding protein [Kineosporiaceae bacterium]